MKAQAVKPMPRSSAPLVVFSTPVHAAHISPNVAVRSPFYDEGALRKEHVKMLTCLHTCLLGFLVFHLAPPLS